MLTIGDGIVTQVPALIVATATGIIVTRAASDARLGEEVSRQVMAYPKTIAIVAIALIALGFLPGVPLLPVTLLLCIAGVLLWVASRKAVAPAAKAEAAAKAGSPADDLYRAMQVDPVEIVIGAALMPVVGEGGEQLAENLSGIRKQYALDMGVVMPLVRVRDDKRLPPNRYEVRIFGARVAEGEVFPDRLLAINPGGARVTLEGVSAFDPAYGLPAVWVTEDRRQSAKASGYTVVDGGTVFLTHVAETLRQQAHNLITRAEVERLIARVREHQASLVDDLIPKVLALGDVQRIVQSLVKERVSIRNMDAILEVLSDCGVRNRDPDHLTEQVRERLAPTICQQLADPKGEIHVLTFDPAVEQSLTSAVRAVEDKTALVLEPRFAEQVLKRLSEEVDRMAKNNMRPVLLCAPNLRRHVRRFTERLVPQLSVLSLNEISGHISLRAYGVVKL
ncbi:MAG TPA: flagellar biosynthesis protein FlhA [Candidatus Synoicihabitans sp.]|nr:flagellar biosynthesis protein FlhA [Candidatus Synoicihabitans sp.]